MQCNVLKQFVFKAVNSMDLFVQRFRMTITKGLTKRAQTCLMFKLVASFSDTLGSRLELPAGRNSEIHPLFGKTIVFSVTGAEEVSLTLYQKAQIALALVKISCRNFIVLMKASQSRRKKPQIHQTF